jgi:hypothetical protein
MTDAIATLLDEALPPLPPRAPHWDDVLVRAGIRRRPVARRVLVAALAALVVAGGAFGSSSGLRALIVGRTSGIVLASRLGTAGEVQLVMRGFYVAHGRALVVGRLLPTGRHRVFPGTVPVRWNVVLHAGPSRVTLALRGRTVATLCSPCPDGAHGTLRLRPRVVQALLSGRGEAVLAAPHTAAPLRMRPY